MRGTVLAAAGLGILLSIAPVAENSAAPSKTPTTAATLTPSEKLNAEASALYEEKDIEGALAKLNEALSLEPLPGAARGTIQFRRAFVLQELQRYSEAVPVAAEASAMLSTDPEPLFLLADIQARAGQTIDASRTIVAIADRFPNQLNNLSFRWVSTLLHRLDENTHTDERFDLILALAARDYNGGEGPGAIDWLKRNAVRSLLQRNRPDDALTYARRVINNAVMLQLLVDRQYQPLWHDLEQTAKADLSGQVAIHYEAAAAAYRKDPKNPRLLQTYLEGAEGYGRRQEAMAAAIPLVESKAWLDEHGTDAYWAAHELAWSLANDGRVDEADALLEKIVTLGIQKQQDVFTIGGNHGVLLIAHNRPERALEIATRLESIGPSPLSAGQRMVARQIKTCALAMLGRQPEAEAVLRQMTSEKDADLDAYLTALLCQSRLDEAEVIVLQRLADTKERPYMLMLLQDREMTAAIPYDSIRQQRLVEVRNRPKVRQAIEAVGRILPVPVKGIY